jgi:hypothetical protein
VKFIKEAAPADCQIWAVRHKFDLEADHRVQKRDAEAYANDVGTDFCLEGSARSGDNIDMAWRGKSHVGKEENTTVMELEKTPKSAGRTPKCSSRGLELVSPFF